MTRTPKPTFTLGAWRPDRTAPVLDAAGQPVGQLIQLRGWYELEMPDAAGAPVRKPGGKLIEMALRRFSYFYTDLRTAA